MASPTERKALTFDDLSKLSSADLGRLYADGAVPDSLAVLDGEREGRLLAVRFVDQSFLGRQLAKFAKSNAFLWEGKNFRSKDATTGTGVNRIKLLGRMVPFETRIVSSPRDGRPAIAFNYDLPTNPPPLNRIYDELREISPGIFLGPSLWKTKKGYELLLWFAVA